MVIDSDLLEQNLVDEGKPRISKGDFKVRLNRSFGLDLLGGNLSERSKSIMSKMIKNILYLIVIVSFIFLISPQLSASREQFIEVKKGGKVTRINIQPYTSNDRKTSELIPLQSVNYNTVEQFCRHLLSKDGTIGYIPERNSVFVYDKLRVINKIKKIIKSIDFPVVNIRIIVDFNSRGIGDRYEIGNKRKHSRYSSGSDITIINGKVIKRKHPFNFSEHQTHTTRNTSQFIVTASGSSASLWVGKKIVDPSWLRNYRLIPTYIIGNNGSSIIIPGNNPEFVWTNVGASLQVTPRYLGNNMIEVEVFPQISYLDGKRKKRNVKFEGISTKVVIRSGQKLDLGGVIDKQKDFYFNLFGPDFISDKSNNSLLDMTISAEVIKPTSSLNFNR